MTPNPFGRVITAMVTPMREDGRLDLDAFVSERIGMQDIEQAFDKMHRGDVLRSVVEVKA